MPTTDHFSVSRTIVLDADERFVREVTPKHGKPFTYLVERVRVTFDKGDTRYVETAGPGIKKDGDLSLVSRSERFYQSIPDGVLPNWLMAKIDAPIEVPDWIVGGAR